MTTPTDETREVLSADKFGALLAQATAWRNADACALLALHDEALRAKLAAAERERDDAQERDARSFAGAMNWQREVQRLDDAVAALRSERDAALARMKEVRDASLLTYRENQDLTAQVRDLQEALGFIVNAFDGCDEYEDQVLAVVQAKEALARTEPGEAKTGDRHDGSNQTQANEKTPDLDGRRVDSSTLLEEARSALETECDVRKDRTRRGQYACGTHGVWFRGADTLDEESGLCPVGEFAACALAKLDTPARSGTRPDAEFNALRGPSEGGSADKHPGAGQRESAGHSGLNSAAGGVNPKRLELLGAVVARARGTKLCQLCGAGYYKGQTHADDCEIAALDAHDKAGGV